MRFWLDFGRARELQKSIKNRKNRVRDDFVARLKFRIDFGGDFEAILVDFGWILEGFWKDLGRILGKFLEEFDLQTMIRATKGTSIRPNHMPSHLDALQTLRRASCIASRNKLRLASLFGAILEVLGGQNRCPNSIFEPFFSMSFSKAFLHRNLVDF